MASDTSRKIFNPRKHYNGVLMQQGRVQLDSDWNEQLDIQQHRLHTETVDVIGESGVPKALNNANAFKISAPNANDLTIAPGRMYVGGLLCELEEAGTYFAQPYYPNPDDRFFLGSPPSPPGPNRLADGAYIVYIDAWQREVNHIDDPRIKEVALGEADTTTRLQTVWQVKLLRIQDLNADCKSNNPEWDSLIAPPTGVLNVRTLQAAPTDDPCLLPPQSGYRRLENQHYRVEVHTGGTLGQTTFKWSRDNASVETQILSVSGSIITVADTGKDEMLGFAPGQWVEIVDEASDLNASPKPLCQIASVDFGRREIALNAPTPSASGRMKLRRWDQSGTASGLSASASWLDLEEGIQVNFSAGTYRSGDYWHFPARTATGEVEWPPFETPNTSPIAQLPWGKHHAYCKLAVLRVSGGAVSVLDCRPLFSPLTEIEPCDLREHNKHLHGYGVVCGLKVKCRATRNGVLIEKGYALDCEGNPLRVVHTLAYDLVDIATEQNLLDEKGDGSFCISIANGAGNKPVVSIEPHIPQGFWDRVLEGTLLKDFYDDCILSLINFLKSQISSSAADVIPVPETQRRLTSLANLLIQLINPKSAPYGYISRKEHDLLHKFWQDLRDRLASETYCGMFDLDTPYLDYPLDPGMDTIFGNVVRPHTRLRLHPNGSFGYTCGGNNRVYVYNLESRELIQATPFPAGSGIILQDIAISQEGNRLFAVGLTGADSTFAAAEISIDGTLTWGNPSVGASGTKYVSLGMRNNGQLYAIAKAQGLHAINGVGTGNTVQATIVRQFNATGLLYMLPGNENLAYAGENASNSMGNEVENFEAIRVISFANNQANRIEVSGVDAYNDICSYRDSVFISCDDGQGNRRVLAYNRQGNQLLGNALLSSLNPATIIRLAVYEGNRQEIPYLLVSLSDMFKVVRVPINFQNFTVDPTFRIPVQMFATSMALDLKGRRGYVLHSIVNTLTVMEMETVFDASPSRPNYTLEAPEDLAEYRDQAIDAFGDVLSHLLQYLKDCFCDKFLVDCPECDLDSKIYLGCVEVRNGKVHNICNFTKRKYVKTFPTIEYWLSTVPLLSILGDVLGQLCCRILGSKTFVWKGNK